jgi:hypothetical protein
MEFTAAGTVADFHGIPFSSFSINLLKEEPFIERQRYMIIEYDVSIWPTNFKNIFGSYPHICL